MFFVFEHDILHARYINMPIVDLKTLLQAYEGQWVALSEDDQTVLGAGSTAKTALEAARAQGHDDVTLQYVQPSDVLYCGVSYHLPRL